MLFTLAFTRFFIVLSCIELASSRYKFITTLPHFNSKPRHKLSYLSFLTGIKTRQKQTAMGGNNNKQRKSSSGFMSVFSMFKSSKKNRGGYYDSHDDGLKARGRVWPSDEDKGRWGVAEPGIDIKAEAFIARCRRRVSESERFEIDPTETDA